LSDEELAALMSGDIDLDSVDTSEESSKKEEATPTPVPDKKEERGGVTGIFPAAPALNEDNRMVEQLDDVTRDSEKKATEIFDSIDNINEALSNMEEKIGTSVKENLENNIEIFEKLSENFPKIEAFKKALEMNQTCVNSMSDISEDIFNNQDEIMMIMDKMQYQDIHRQKIERVINVMRSLALYMNHLFSSNVDDSKRTSSAKHLEGDQGNDLVDEDDLETLIASFGDK
jgi:chemotaxis regulatin CheY-phosphate phosphatase CheZ